MHAGAIDREVVAAVVPVGQHEAFAQRSIDHVLVPRGPMRMAMDHASRVVPGKRGNDGAGRDIHDGFRLQRFLVAALAPQPPGEAAPREVGKAQQPRLRDRIAHAGAIRLVLGVVGAQLVAVA